MTISEQIREAALYAVDPIGEMGDDAFNAARSYRYGHQQICLMPDEGRTFLLIVAEALE